jgi:phospholipid/cholesterol/gamma-HCH transport system substrate-binding protein
MKNHNLLVGSFITAAVVLFGAGLFLIGNQHKAFSHHSMFYTNLQNVDGLTKGAKIRVDGMDAGEVESVQIPSSPAKKFRLRMTVGDRLHGLIREDSLVTVETEGIVGEKFLLINAGSEQASEAPAGSTLPSKEPFELSTLLEQAQGIMKQAGTTISEVQDTMNDVRGHLDATLDTATSTIKNVNRVVQDVRSGKGSVGMLLEDRATAADLRQSVANIRQATEKLNGSSTRIDSILTDIQSRQLVGKMDDTLASAESATHNLDQTSQQIDTTLKSAFAQNQYGEDAGTDLQQSFTNIDQATGNLADDAEALKHEFFFRGFFRHRGYDDLDDLPVVQYRAGQIFKGLPESRQWMPAPSLFATNGDGEEVLSAQGRHNIDEAIGQFNEIYGQPLIIEGYSSLDSASDQLLQSRRRATLVRTYLQLRFHILPKNIGIVALKGTPPRKAGKSAFDGVSLVSVGMKENEPRK